MRFGLCLEDVGFECADLRLRSGEFKCVLLFNRTQHLFIQRARGSVGLVMIMTMTMAMTMTVAVATFPGLELKNEEDTPWLQPLSELFGSTAWVIKVMESQL